MDAIRKQNEIRHGREIAAHAESVWRRNSPSGKRRLENRAHLFKAYVGALAPSARVLELGCGTGLWTETLATLPASVVSMDISPDLLEVARQKFSPGRVEFICGDVENLPFADHHFDVVCGLSVLHHLDLTRILPQLVRVLKPAGRLWFSEPNMLNPQIMLQKNIPLLKRWSGDTPDETAFFRWPMTQALKRVGFNQVQVRPFDFLHPSIPGFATTLADRLGILLEKTPILREIGGSLEIQAQKPTSA